MNQFQFVALQTPAPLTDIKTSIPFSAINEIAKDFYPIIELKLRDLAINQEILDFKLGSLITANLTLGTIQQVTVDYSNSVLISGVASSDPNVSKAQLHLQNVGISMNFTYAIEALGFITDAHPATMTMKGLSLAIDLTLETPSATNWTIGASLGQATLDELSIDFNEKFPLSPLSTIWNILAGNQNDQQRLVNQLIEAVNAKLSAVKLDYNVPIKTTVKGMDVTLALTAPVKFENISGDWTFQLKGGANLGYKGETAPDLYNPDMNLTSPQSKSSHLYVSANLVNNLLWGVYKSGMGQFSISQATLDSLKVDLLRLYTDDVTILFMNILKTYPARKGLYINLNLDQYDSASTRVTMVQGRLGILLKANLQLWVDTDSSKYPQNFADCTTCEQAADMTLDLFVGVSASFTNDGLLWFTTPEINIYKLVTNKSTFTIDSAFFQSATNNLIASLAGGFPNSLDFSIGILGPLHPEIDILGELLHIQLG
jgi:hypothetical protein